MRSEGRRETLGQGVGERQGGGRVGGNSTAFVFSEPEGLMAALISFSSPFLLLSPKSLSK